MAHWNNEFMADTSKLTRYRRRPTAKREPRSDRYTVARGDEVYVNVGPRRDVVIATVATDADERGEFLLKISPMHHQKAGCEELRSTRAGLVVLRKWYELKRSV